MSLIEIVGADRDEDSPQAKAYFASLCSCSCADVCPLGKRGMAGRCTTNELRDGFLAYKRRIERIAGELRK